MKKTLMALLALTLVFVMVFAVACNSGTGDSTDDGNDSDNGTNVPTPPDGGNGNPPTPPDGNGGNGGNNGGGTATVPSPVTDGAESTVAAGAIDLSAASADTDASGSTVVEVTTVKVCQSVIISSAALQNGATYTLYAGTGQLAQVTISSTITSAGTSQGGPGGGGQGGQPGGPGGWGGR